MKKILTLCIIHKAPKVLLGLKKRGFGQGWWNGFGGKVEAGESITEAALREVQEEVGITPKDLVEVGVLDFEYKSEPIVLEVHIFKCHKFSGKPGETEEMRPEWFLETEIPYDQMWPDDKHWLPLLLAGKKFRGNILFEKSNKIIRATINTHE